MEAVLVLLYSVVVVLAMLNGSKEPVPGVKPKGLARLFATIDSDGAK